MNYFENLKEWFLKLHISQQISIGALILCIPILITLSVSAISNSINSNNSSSIIPSSSEETSSIIISSSEEESSSFAESSSAEAVKITLKPSSVEEDLEVKIVNEKDQLVTGYEFNLTVESKKNNYNKSWSVDDGFLKLSKLKAGDYLITIADAEGYIIPEKTVECKVKEKVKYEKVDVTDKIKDESSIDVGKEDAGLSKPVETPQPTPAAPTYQDIPATEKEVVTTYKYKAEISTGDFIEPNVGFILNKDGTKSRYAAKVDKNGVIQGEIRIMPIEKYSAVRLYKRDVIFTNSLIDSYPSKQYRIMHIRNEIAKLDDTVTDETTPAPENTPNSTPDSTPESKPESTPDSTPDSTPESKPESTPDSKPDSNTDSSSSNSDNSSNSIPTPTPPPQQSFENGKPAEVYDSENGKISQVFLDSLKLTDVSESTKVYYNGWSPDKNSYYDANGNKLKGQILIGGKLYDFDSQGNIIKNVVKGIDVSKYQPRVDWNAVKASGVDYVIIRAGYRGYGSGVLVEDPYFKKHIAGAKAAGLKVGLYLYSQAITAEEAVEEASMVLQLAKGYSLEYPIYFDTEATGTGVGRADGLSKSHRTAIARAFCETIRNSGYKAGVYASKSWFYHQLDYGQIAQYDIWLAHYTSATDFKHRYDMWQYTGSGSCPGIPNAVDLNWAYKVY